jgi:putative aldouronate transport system substrate-binding protein
MVKKLHKTLALSLAILLLASIFAGCGAESAPAAADEPAPAAAPAAPAEAAADPAAATPAAPGELFKYDPPITATFGKAHDINSDGFLKMEEAGEPYTDNRWIQYFRDEVGVEASYSVIGPTFVDYEQKLVMAMSAGDLPDIFYVNSSNLALVKQMVDGGAIADLTDVYAQYANETLRSVIEFEGPEIYNPVMFDGRMMAIPVKMPSTNEYNHLWVRQQWLDELGLERPKTMDDVKAIAKAFKEKAEGNIGLMINNEYIEESKGIFWAFGGETGRRKQWVTLDDGTVGFSEVQPEMKGGLSWLRDMYAEGLINQEFGTQDINKAFEYVANNQCGIFFGPHWYGFSLANAEGTLDPEANFVAVGLMEGSEAPKVHGTNTFDHVICVRADYEYPEAVVHMMNAYEEKLYGENNDFENYFASPENSGLWGTGPVHALHPMVDLTPHREIKAAVAAGTTDALTGSAKSYWEYITTGQRAYDYMFGPEDSCFNFVDDTYPDIISWNAYAGAPTATWADRWGSLKELIDTSYLKMIQGTVEVDAGFDAMVAEWNALGGEQVTQEVNDVVATY